MADPPGNRDSDPRSAADPSGTAEKASAQQAQILLEQQAKDEFASEQKEYDEAYQQYLEAIENGGAPMVFPNVFVKVNNTKTYELTLYMDKPAGNGNYTCTVKDDSIANVEIEGTKLTVEGFATGQTAATVTNGKDVHNFVITVSASATSNGWM